MRVDSVALEALVLELLLLLLARRMALLLRLLPVRRMALLLRLLLARRMALLLRLLLGRRMARRMARLVVLKLSTPGHVWHAETQEW